MKKKYIFAFLAVVSATTASAQTMPYQNPALPVEQRVDDLMQRLTLEEKTQLMMNSSPAIPRLGIPQFDWWSEALHGVGRNGLATVFPSCIGMACSFDDDLIEQIYVAVSDEARAKNTQRRREGKPIGKYQALSFWTPNINIFRDPRWGRGQETYGEDPFMNARMGLRVVRGLQGTANPYYKLHACAKHFAVHSGPEKLRHSFNIEDLPARDLWETYLPAFKTLVQEGNVQQVMCAYQRFEGDPCCGSNRLLQQILRDEWGFKGLVVSDCGAIGDFWQPKRHGVSTDAANASAKAVLSGTDVECGRNYKDLPEAVRRGDISEEQINVSVRRLLKGRFELGNLDADSLVEWTNIPASVVSSKEHRNLARQMGREQMVLLKNNGILPLQTTKLMVMGPNAADSTMLWGIYFGTPAHTVTPLEGIEARLGKVPFMQACDFTSITVEQKAIGKSTETADGSTTLQMETTSKKTYTIADILEASRDTETIIFVGGISPNLEKEQAKVNVPGFDGGDRTTIELPQVQRDILRALHEAGKKIVFVNCSGSAVALTPEMETCDAILQAWYAGEQGGHALADVLFGDYNPSGKLAVTFYKDDSQLPPFEEYKMENRTYRFFRGEPLFPFGYGLSYTTFELKGEKIKKQKDGSFEVSVKVKNTGKREGTEIVQVYLRRPGDTDGPSKTLRGYARISLLPGEQQTCTVTLPRDRFEWWDGQTNTMHVLPGQYEVLVGTSSADKDLKVLPVKL
ncbi:MAG: glycoside hydrolase family 3 C-terminal domain-containing protein [Prevotella sp.]|nr:glycoside hydrolase family 3 C-terminal domain-containing protein [Prevotella sp.]